MSSAQPLTGRVPFTTPQISATYDAQQMRTVLNGIVRSIPVSAGTINVTEPPYGARPNTGPRWETYDDAVASGHDSSAAFNAALADVLVTGGKLIIPGGQYYLNRQWLGTYTNQYAKVAIDMDGAELFAGPEVTDAALAILGRSPPYGITVRGGTFNHRGNATVTSCVKLTQTSHAMLDDIVCEMHGVKPGYAMIHLASGTPGDADSCNFWTKIVKCRIRERSGGDGSIATHGVLVEGAHNATNILDCSFTSVVNSVSFITDGVNTSLANGCLALGNHCEGDGMVTAFNTVAVAGGYWPSGNRYIGNRIEALTTYMSFTKTGEGAVLNPATPTSSAFNYSVNGNVTNYIVNPENAPVTQFDPIMYGVNTDGIKLFANGAYRLVMTGGNLLLAQTLGYSTWVEGHLQFGEENGSSAHVWVDTGTQLLRYKFGSAPTSASDGVAFTFGGNEVASLGPSPRFSWDATTAAADTKRWDFIASSSGTLKLRLLNDAQNAATDVFQIVRTAMAVTRIDMNTNVAVETDGAFDLGSAASRWRNLFLSDGLKIQEGSNKTLGRVALVAGTATVSTTKVTASSEIFLTSQIPGGTPGFYEVSARAVGTSFTITSSSALDTSTIAWMIVEPT